jgi:hypothetical protein
MGIILTVTATSGFVEAGDRPRRCHFQYRDPPPKWTDLPPTCEHGVRRHATSNRWDYSIYAKLGIWLFNFFYALTNIASCVFKKLPLQSA